MFNQIIVSEEILPVREAASLGDIDAMYKLTEHILNGKQTARTSRYAENVLDAMFKHPDFLKDLQRFCNCYVMRTTLLRIRYQEELISYRDYVEQSCDYLQMMIDCMTTAPRHMWNYSQLINCIDWIAEHEKTLNEEEVN